MNEEKVLAIYWEIYNKHAELEQSLKDQGGKWDQRSSDKLGELASILQELKAKALGVGIDVSKGNPGLAKDNNDRNDWIQLIQAAKMDGLKQRKLIEKILSFNLKPHPSGSAVWPLIQELDDFYTKTVLNAESFPKDDAFKNATAELIRAAGLVTIDQAIDAVTPDFKIGGSSLTKRHAGHMETPENLVIEENENWRAVVEKSELVPSLKKKLIKKIEDSGENPPSFLIKPIIQQTNRYYDRNVVIMDEKKIVERMKPWIGNKIPEDKVPAYLTLYKTAALEAVDNAIENLDTKSWRLTINDNLHKYFKDVLSSMKSVEDAVEHIKKSPIFNELPFQLKERVLSIPFPWEGEKIGFKGFNFHNPQFELSYKASIKKTTQAISFSEATFFEKGDPFFTNLFRTTLSTGWGKAASKFSLKTTVLSTGLELYKDQDFSIILKLEAGNIDIQEMIKKAIGSKEKIFSLGPAIIIQFNHNTNKSLMDKIRINFKNTLNIERVILSASFKVELSLDPDFARKYVKEKAKKEAKEKLAKEAAEKAEKESVEKLERELADDMTKIEKMKKKGDEIISKAKDLGNRVKGYNYEVPQGALDNDIKDLKKDNKIFKELYENTKWRTPEGKKAADEIMEKVGKEAVEELGGDTLIKKISKKAGGFIAKKAMYAVPIVGAVFLFMDILDGLTLLYYLVNNNSGGNMSWGRGI